MAVAEDDEDGTPLLYCSTALGSRNGEQPQPQNDCDGEEWESLHGEDRGEAAGEEVEHRPQPQRWSSLRNMASSPSWGCSIAIDLHPPEGMVAAALPVDADVDVDAHADAEVVVAAVEA